LLSFGEGEDRVVLKVVSSLNKKEQRHLRSEFQMLSGLNHPHIISPLKYQEHIADPTRTPPPPPNTPPSTLPPLSPQPTSNILVLEFAAHGSLLRYLHSNPLPLPTARRFFHQITSALHYCHSRSIAHRDLKLDNILVFSGEELSVKVSDFGFAERCVKEGRKVVFGDYKGTRKGYMAPEIHVVRSHP
jgi:serine/threonine protein kinase